MSKTDRQQYKIAGPATWELIRAAYLGGDSARVLAERFGVSEHAIRKRINVEKWTKRDYAAALEARGVSQQKIKPDFIEEGVLREQMRQAAEAREVEARASELDALVEQIASQEDTAGMAAVLERRALAQASAEMVQGRSKEAQALMEMAELMRKRAGVVAPVAAPVLSAAALLEAALSGRADNAEMSFEDYERRALAQGYAALNEGRAADAKTYMALADQMRQRIEAANVVEETAREAVLRTQAQAEADICELFTRVAKVASAMVHNPSTAPAAFQGLIKLWREHNLGEGEEDADRAAAKITASNMAFLEARDEDNWPVWLRQHFDEQWKARREELEGQPVIPHRWAPNEKRE